MFINSPQSFLFCCLYFFLVFSLFYVSDFLIFWCLMEMSTIVFIGIGYSFLNNSFSFFLVFFVVQSLSAFLLLFSFVLGSCFLFTFSLFMKLSIFPFHFWFIGLVQYFPNFVFFLVSTAFNIPGVYLLVYYSFLFDLPLVVLCSLVNLFVGGVLICGSLDLRFLLIASSVSNNSWMLMSCYSSVLLFWCFIAVYSLFLFILLCSINSSISFQYNSFSSSSVFSVLSLISLSGLPPFPMFFVKIGVVYGLLLWGVPLIYLGFFMLFTVILLGGYMMFFFKVFLLLNLTESSVFLYY